MKKMIFLFCIFLAFLWHAAERREHAEDVVLRMSQEHFDSIKSILGEDANIVKIADYYEQHYK